LQDWRSPLIRCWPFPVSIWWHVLFLFPLVGLSIKHLSMFGGCCYWLVVDDAIGVVGRLQRHSEEGLRPKVRLD